MESFTFYLYIASLCAFVFIVLFASIFGQSTEPTWNLRLEINVIIIIIFIKMEENQFYNGISVPEVGILESRITNT